MSYFTDIGIELEIVEIVDKNGKRTGTKRIWIDGMDLARAITEFELHYGAKQTSKATITFHLSSVEYSKERE